MSGIAGGISVSIGAVAYLSADSKVVGAFLFSIGIFVIITFGMHLFTSRVCYTLDHGPSYLIDLLLIWSGNLAGSFIFGNLVRLTRISGIALKAASICEIKAADGALSLFILGAFCGIMICIVSEVFRNCEYPLGKYLGIFIAIPVFILSGYEHCVANGFYFSLAAMWSPAVFFQLLIVTAGNSVGGLLIPLFQRFMKSEKRRNETADLPEGAEKEMVKVKV